MIKRFRFAIVYAWLNMARHPQRAMFALLSIAAGVATVTALRMLGLLLTDALTANAQAFLRADILVAPAASPLRLSAGENDASAPLFLPDDTAKLNHWAARNNVELTYRLSGQLFQVSTITEDVPESSLTFGYFIDPAKYPFYDVIRAVDPAGTPLAELFVEPQSVVVAQHMAQQLDLKIGDSLRIGSAELPFIITGIVPDSAENNLDNPFGLAFSFVYLDYDTLGMFGIPRGMADRVYLRLPEGVSPEVMVDQVYAEWRGLVPSLVGKHVRYDRVSNVIQRNAQIAGFVSRAVLLLSLIALVIGGVGILNTMFVTVNRRTEEIAILKSLGLRRADIAQIFFTHALILGIIGSIIGVTLGVLVSLIAREIGEATFGVTVPWRVRLDPILLGMALGTGVTAIFSILPTVSAVRVAPKMLLRAGEIVLTHAGVRPAVLTFALLTVVTGLLIDLILGVDGRGAFDVPSLVTGIAAAALAFGALMLGGAFMWLVVWLLSRLPAFKNPHLLLAIRGLSQQRGRTAFTLLALVIGMASLSATLILSRSISALIYSSISEPLGGNVIIVPLLPLTQNALHNRLAESEGITSYYDVAVTQAELIAVNNDPLFRVKLGPEEDLSSDLYLNQLNFITGIRRYGEADTTSLLAGRLLTPDDAGQNRIVIPYNLVLVRLGVGVGSTFTYRIENRTQTFTIVGIIRPNPQAGLIPFGLGNNGVVAPIESIPQELPFNLIVANVQRAAVPTLSAALRDIPGVFVFDINTFDSIINRVLRQISALPLLIATLSLFASSILMASTVSLATIERKQEIGLLKAIGLKRRQLLAQLLVQNGVVGLVGGLISLLPTLLAIELVPVVTDEIVQLPLPLDLIALMLAISIGVTMIATLLTAWSTVREKPITALHTG